MKVMGASDYLQYTIWTKWVIEAQGYKISMNIFYQDNQSLMKMEKNRKASCREKSRHIDIRHFLLKMSLKEKT